MPLGAGCLKKDAVAQLDGTPMPIQGDALDGHPHMLCKDVLLMSEVTMSKMKVLIRDFMWIL